MVIKGLKKGKGRCDCILATHRNRSLRLAAHQRVQMRAGHLGITIEPDHVFGQSCEGNLCLEDFNLRDLADAVLDARSLNGLLRNSHVLIVNANFILRVQHLEEGFAYLNAKPKAHGLELSFCQFHVRLREVGAKFSLASTWN